MTTLAPEYPVLGMLLEQPSHGYALHAKLRADLGELWNISLSQTYNILKRLEQNSLIVGSPQPQPAKPDRYEFQLTASGRDHFNRWLLEASNPSSQALRVEFLTRLYFARRHRPELLQSLVEKQAADIGHALDHLRRRLQRLEASSQINQWALEIRIAQTQGILDWLSQNKPELTLPTKENQATS